MCGGAEEDEPRTGRRVGWVAGRPHRRPGAPSGAADAKPTLSKSQSQIGFQPNRRDNRLNYTPLTSPNTQIHMEIISREVFSGGRIGGRECQYVERTDTPNRLFSTAWPGGALGTTEPQDSSHTDGFCCSIATRPLVGPQFMAGV